MLKKPLAAAAAARQKARLDSRKDQRRRTDSRTFAAADHLILITSLDREAFPPDRLARLYRLRWQIELAFKRLKSILNIDRLPARQPVLARAWLLAHLLLALLADDIRSELDVFSPSPPH